MRRFFLLLTYIIFIGHCGSAQSQAAVSASEGGYGMLKTNIAVDYNHTWNRVDNGFSARASYEFFKNSNIIGKTKRAILENEMCNF